MCRPDWLKRWWRLVPHRTIPGAKHGDGTEIWCKRCCTWQSAEEG